MDRLPTPSNPNTTYKAFFTFIPKKIQSIKHDEVAKQTGGQQFLLYGINLRKQIWPRMDGYDDRKNKGHDQQQ